MKQHDTRQPHHAHPVHPVKRVVIFLDRQPEALRLGLTFVPAVLLLAGAFLFPVGICAVLAILSITAIAAIRTPPNLRSIALAITVLALSLALALKPGSNMLFLALAGTFLAVVRLEHLPKVFRWVLGGVILLVSIPAAGFANTFIFELGIQIGIYAAMALGLNVVVGMAGLLDMGYAAFFAIGAYTWGIFGSPQAAQFMSGNFPLNGWFFYLFMFIAILTTAITGIIIGLPALRLRGDYLAIVTLGLGEVVRVLANNLDHPVNLTNGPQGITPVVRPPIDWFKSIFDFFGIHLDARTDYQLFFYLLVLLVIAGIVIVKTNAGKSRYGRAWIAIREDEIAAKAMGVPMVKTKLVAFATGAAFSGAMGVIFAAQRTFVSPETFTLLSSIIILGMVVLGGMGSIQGVILGAAALTILNIDVLKGLSEWLSSLRQSDATFLGLRFADLPNQLDPAKYERLVFGIILVLMMLFRPEGLIPEKRRDETAHNKEGEPKGEAIADKPADSNKGGKE